MEKTGPSDPELLAEWLEQQREAAFRALVTRYAGLVLMTARRTCGGDDSLAAEASQLTFLLLARKAKSLLTCASLGGWLHRAALMNAKNLRRAAQSESRKREKLFATMNSQPSESPDDPWQELQPVLDEALAALPDKYREALLLRFYRSLGVREIGETLGISTDAAQKRIDRGTSRLRDRLGRLGCPVAGTSLGALLLAGFTADAQAAAAAGPLIAGKVLAASATSAAAGSSTFITALSMKASSYVIPATAVLAVVWLASQRLALAKLESGNATLTAALASTGTPIRNPSTRKRIPTALDADPIDWLTVAKHLSEHEWVGDDQAPFLTLRQHLLNGFYKLDRDRLVAALDEIEGLQFEPRQREVLEKQLLERLLEKDPETAMTRVIKSKIENLAQELMGRWADQSADKAAAWLDERIVAGDLDGTGLRKFSELRICFEQRLIYPLIRTNVDAAGRRLATFPANMRYGIIFDGGGTFPAMRPEHEAGFARMVREHLPAADASRAIVDEATDRRYFRSYDEIEAYWKHTGVTEEERRKIIVGVANNIIFPLKSGKYMQVGPEDLDALRTWLGKQAPELKEEAIGRVFSQLSHGNMKYPDVVALAFHCQDQGSGDEVLLPLTSERKPEHAALVRSVISRISDPKRREEALRSLTPATGQ